MTGAIERIQRAAFGEGKIARVGRIKLRPLRDEDLKNLEVEIHQYRPFSKRAIVENGVFDLRIKDKWGYISLPLPVINPVLLNLVSGLFNAKTQDLLSHRRYGVFLAPDKKGKLIISGQPYRGEIVFEDDEGEIVPPEGGIYTGDRIKGVIEALKLADKAVSCGFSPKDFLITRWPVIPWSYRPFSDFGWGLIMHPLNLLYIRLLMIITRMKKLEAEARWEEVPAAYTLLQKAVYEVVFGGASQGQNQVSGTLFSLVGKEGVVRQRILGQRVDYSGRAVIVPAPDLHIDEVYIPKSIATDILRPHIIRNIRNEGYKGDISRKMIEDWLPTVEGTPILINRQPTLHKYSIMGFKARFWDKDVIGLHPFVVEPFNADFDGDTMAIYAALTEEGTEDVMSRMMVTKNMTLPSGKVYAVPRHDYLHGLWRLTRECTSPGRPVKTEGLEVEDLIKLVDKRGPCAKTTEGLTLGRVLVSRAIGKRVDFELNKKTIRELTTPLEDYLKIIDTLKELGARYASESFSLRDLWELQPNEKPSSIDELEKDIERLKKIENPATNMIRSGSRGSWRQLQQVVSSKGFTRSPSGLRRVESSLIEGLDPEEYWDALHESRASLADKVVTIADPGYLARRLVMASMDQIVQKGTCTSPGLVIKREHAEGLNIIEDLGDYVRVRTPATCQVEGPGVCEACANAKPGDYLGVLAATTLSEPTTQMTLRVFHTGGEAGNVPIISTVEGVVEAVEEHFIAVSGGYKIYIPEGYEIQVSEGGRIELGDVVATRVASIGITQDFKDLEALYELRPTGGIVSTEEGALSIELKSGKVILRVGKKSYRVSPDKRILKAHGERVKVGDYLTDGVPNYRALYEELGEQAIVLWLEQIRGLYERNNIWVSSRDLLAIARAMFVDGKWMGVKHSMNSKRDIVLRLGAEAAVQAIIGKEVEFDMSSEASRVLFEVPPYGSGYGV